MPDYRDRWKVVCDNCGSILEAGVGEAYLSHRRHQMPCPTCGGVERSLRLGDDVFDGGETPPNPDDWPRSLKTAAIGARVQTRYPVLPDLDDEDVIGLFVGDDAIDVAAPAGVSATASIDPRAPHIQPERDAAQEKAVEQLAGPEQWRSWTLHGPPPVSRGGWLWVGEIGQFLQLLMDVTNAAVTTLSTWGGAAAAVYGAAKVLERATGTPPRINRGAAAAIAAAELEKRVGDRPAEKLFVQPLDSEEVLSEGYVVAYQGEKHLWLVILDRQGKVIGVLETDRPKRWRRH